MVIGSMIGRIGGSVIKFWLRNECLSFREERLVIILLSQDKTLGGFATRIKSEVALFFDCLGMADHTMTFSSNEEK